MSPTERGRAVIASGLVLLLGGCSWIPFLGDSAPHLTNAAVAACEDKAESLGYDGVGERQSVPESNGRYTVVLDILQNEGYGQVSCTYDPAKGADVPPPKAAEK